MRVPGGGGSALSNEAKRRDVLELLRGYRAYHAIYGSAMALEDSHLRSADYGPSGLIRTGAMYYDEDGVNLTLLAESYGHLDRALEQARESPDDRVFSAWILLKSPFTGDPGDPSLYEKWKRTHPQTAQEVDILVSWLARKMPDDLYVVFPRLMSEVEDKKIENQNAEINAIFHRIRATGKTERVAAEQTAAFFSQEKDVPLSVDRVEKIIEFRDTLKPTACRESGCDKEPDKQGLCTRHYWQDYRRRKKESEKAC